MKITIPDLSLVVLIGASGAGKSTFARAHFRPTEVLSSDACRALISDDENNQAVSVDAFEALHFLIGKRLRHGRLTVVDATNTQEAARRPLIALAKEHHVLPVAVVFDVPLRLCLDRAGARSDRSMPLPVVQTQHQQVQKALRELDREGFRKVFVLRSAQEITEATIERQPLHCDRRFDRGPFDIIGDIHGCGAELRALLERLGYVGSPPRHPDGRRVVFLGDLIDRGPEIPEVLRTAMAMVEAGSALCVPGNHEMKLLRKLNGRDVKLSHGLAETLAQLEHEPPEFIPKLRDFLDGLVPHYVLDGGRLVVAHAGLKQGLQGRASGSVRDFALYGETTGETDQYGLPVRYKWAEEYRGDALVVYGHTPVPEPEWLNNTLCVDTGCVYGGRLTALRYPERELVSVPAAREYCVPSRPFLPPGATGLSAQQAADDLLDMEDVLGKRVIVTRLISSVTLHEEQTLAALEVVSRFAVDPRWLIYLPPTMSPSETSRRPGLLEHPDEAFAYFREAGVAEVICEEKHMGSRAVVIACRDAAAARRRFGDTTGATGICYTRTGRRFFDPQGPQGEAEGALEAALLERVRAAADAAGLWQELATDWLCLDCELMPWSLKAQELLRVQYAAVGAAGRAALGAAVQVLGGATGAAPTGTEGTPARPELLALGERTRERLALLERYVAAYRRYCWPVRGADDLKLAPFHLLASEGAVHTERDHAWHLERLARLCAADRTGVLLATPHRLVTLSDREAVAQATSWWQDLVERGGEGLVIKPRSFIARGPRGLVQPALKCRGPEYLRIIYGPEYSRAENLMRLRSRGVGQKRTLALRELALGIEGLERFVRREPQRRVHECVLGVLALESDPIDPRL